MPSTIQARMDSRLSGLVVFSFTVLSIAFVGCAPAGENSGGSEIHRAYACGLHAPLANTVAPMRMRNKLALRDEAFDAGTELTLTLKDDCESPANSLAALVTNRAAGVTPAGLRAHTIQLPSAMTRDDLAKAVQGDACITSVSASVRAGVGSQANQPTPAPTAVPVAPSPNYLADPLVQQQGHLAFLGADQAYGLAFAGAHAASLAKPVVIAVIDTGVDLAHEDLKGVLWTNPHEIPANQIDDDKNGYVDDVAGWNFPLNTPNAQYIAGLRESQHGTHVAGLAAAQGGDGVGGTGVMGAGVRLMPLNVFASSSGAYVSDIANAIRYAADNGADVINLSLGGEGESAEYESALDYAVNRGVTILAAAGNDHVELGPDHFMSPAAYAAHLNGMLAIGSIDTQTEQLSIYSNYGVSSVGLAAPGAENARIGRGLLSTYPNNSYVRLQGTSMASPVAAGAAAFAIAMYRARGYAPSPATIVGALEISAHANPNIANVIAGGRELSLANLARYIDATYPMHEGTATDPGVPGWTCH